MTETIPIDVLTLDYSEARHWPTEPERIAAICTQLSGLAIAFAGVERVPRYIADKRENDAEHSYMLALVAPEIAQHFRAELDPGLVSQFAIVHDLLEIPTVDVATFNLSEEEITLKEQNEYRAMDEFLERLPPYTATLLLRYEAQIEPEARFVRLIDKLLPVIVDTLGPGKKVMAEDYGVHTDEQLEEAEMRLSNRLRRKFPDQDLKTIHLARDILARTFAEVFSET